jgi:hypothetical protein
MPTASLDLFQSEPYFRALPLSMVVAAALLVMLTAQLLLAACEHVDAIDGQRLRSDAFILA